MSTNSRHIVNAFLVLVLTEVAIGESEFLFRSGWFKDNEKGPKIAISDVPYIDSQVVPDSGYLRIRSAIPVLQKGSVKNLLHLRTLKLVSCGILNVEPGAFLNLPNLATLALYDNEIEHINKGVFNNLTVKRLFLHRNDIQSINTDAFDNMPNLLVLKLNSNKLTTVDSNWFKNTPEITDLYLRRNEITQIPRGAFKNLRSSHFNGAQTDYPNLFLSKNVIVSVHPDAFQGLKGLNQLWLDRNDLEDIDAAIFSQLEYIGVVFLSKNKLDGLPNKLLAGLKVDLLTLDLAGNRNFSCLDYEVVSRVKITNLEKIPKLDCQCVGSLVDQLSRDGEDNEIKTDCKKAEMKV